MRMAHSNTTTKTERRACPPQHSGKEPGRSGKVADTDLEIDLRGAPPLRTRKNGSWSLCCRVPFVLKGGSPPRINSEVSVRYRTGWSRFFPAVRCDVEVRLCALLRLFGVRFAPRRPLSCTTSFGRDECRRGSCQRSLPRSNGSGVAFLHEEAGRGGCSSGLDDAFNCFGCAASSRGEYQ